MHNGGYTKPQCAVPYRVEHGLPLPADALLLPATPALCRHDSNFPYTFPHAIMTTYLCRARRYTRVVDASVNYPA